MKSVRHGDLRARLCAMSIPVPECGCWIWLGHLSHKGYGLYGAMDSTGAKTARAHRLSWYAHHGEIPEGMLVLHRCDVPSCINPDHLFLGTHEDNMRDMVAKGRSHTYHGPDHTKSKLSHDDVRYIRSCDESSYALAKRFNVTPKTIRNVWSGISYKTTPGAPPVLSLRKRKEAARKAASLVEQSAFPEPPVTL